MTCGGGIVRPLSASLSAIGTVARSQLLALAP
jgi:hypothetical protein